MVIDAMGYAYYGDEIFVCPHCGKKCYDQQLYCSRCGKLLHNCCVQEECAACGLDLSADVRYCPECSCETSFSIHQCIEDPEDGC